MKKVIIVLIVAIAVIVVGFVVIRKNHKPASYKREEERVKMVEEAEAYYKEKIESLPEKFNVEDAKSKGYFVYDGQNNKIYNKDVLEEFTKKTEKDAENREKAEIGIVIYNVDGKPAIYYLGFDYNKGLGYTLVTDRRRVVPGVQEGFLEEGEDSEIKVNSSFPREYFGTSIIEDEGIQASIIILKLYAEADDINVMQKGYKDFEIARYMLDAEIVED